MQFLKRKFVIKLQAEDLQLIKNEGAAQMFSCKSCEIFKNTFFIERAPLKTPVIKHLFHIRTIALFVMKNYTIKIF